MIIQEDILQISTAPWPDQYPEENDRNKGVEGNDCAESAILKVVVFVSDQLLLITATFVRFNTQWRILSFALRGINRRLDWVMALHNNQISICFVSRGRSIRGCIC